MKNIIVSTSRYWIRKSHVDNLETRSGEPEDEFRNIIKSLKNENELQFDPGIHTKESYNTEKDILGGIGIYLSCNSHTLEFYNSLPHGWRTTPPGYLTDVFMQLQIFSHKNCKPYFSIKPPSIIYLKRGNYPGLPVDKRLKLIKYWYGLIQDGSYQRKINRLILKGHILKFKKKNVKKLRKIKKRILQIFK